ncbi:unnamed protein product [Rotaria magnacalcarata]|uniref:Uncharacterized protein n=2 Tax=Rotaria magnacalcarata TaxID=392030 RepID=A0A816Z6V2_9BILA|nr:unnamed protein product [Rotaria magnacalcarata]CAF4115989.1 unnamed protein product [Rotaria magnacalcarata]
MPSTLVKILKSDNVVSSSVVHKNTDIDEVESNTTTSSEDFGTDESDSSDNIDSTNINQEKSKNHKKNSTIKTKSLIRSMSTLAVNVDSPLLSPALNIKINSLDLPHDRRCRQESLNQLKQLILDTRQKN